MRTTTIRIDNTEYMLVFNNRVLSRMEQAGIDIAKLSDGRQITQILTMLSFMIEAGSRYAKREGLGEYPILALDDLLDITDQTDYPAIQEAITAVIQGDRTVDAIPPKKAGDPAEGPAS